MSSPESAALLTARAFVNGNATGVEPSVTGREALIAWMDAEMSSDDDWWLVLTLVNFYWARRPASGVSPEAVLGVRRSVFGVEG